MRKTIYAVITFIGLIALLSSNLFGNLLGRLNTLFVDIFGGISGQLGPAPITFIIFAIFIAILGVYTIFSD